MKALAEYDRHESKAHQLDRNWAELVQELRVIGKPAEVGPAEDPQRRPAASS